LPSNITNKGTGLNTVLYDKSIYDNGFYKRDSTSIPGDTLCAAGSDSQSCPSILSSGQTIISNNGQYKLGMQSDGNLVLYWNNVSQWATGTVGTGANKLVLQDDNDLVLYGNTDGPIGWTHQWSSGTRGTGANKLVLQDDGNLVLYVNGPNGWTSKWASGTMRK
jgi:hypothetical protein